MKVNLLVSNIMSYIYVELEQAVMSRFCTSNKRTPLWGAWSLLVFQSNLLAKSQFI